MLVARSAPELTRKSTSLGRQGVLSCVGNTGSPVKDSVSRLCLTKRCVLSLRLHCSVSPTAHPSWLRAGGELATVEGSGSVQLNFATWLVLQAASEARLKDFKDLKDLKDPKDLEGRMFLPSKPLVAPSLQ